ncbi:hypothetical protein [Rhizobium sp. C4]|uniref:hypothetical protein n=1 Tax=Rhizobium sp. C4 TaxID=1349800 RepID=UPI001E4E4897|nr:hypothetical protein [Rhizobium sp. C4]MCD2173974.1 hypothetical protein [Rhizobium sp. C4]
MDGDIQNEFVLAQYLKLPTVQMDELIDGGFLEKHLGKTQKVEYAPFTPHQTLREAIEAAKENKDADLILHMKGGVVKSYFILPHLTVVYNHSHDDFQRIESEVGKPKRKRRTGRIIR